MIKRDITETTYEYDKEGKLVKKTVVETHEEENNTVTTNYPWTYLNGTAVDYATTTKLETASAHNCCGDTCSCSSTSLI